MKWVLLNSAISSKVLFLYLSLYLYVDMDYIVQTIKILIPFHETCQWIFDPQFVAMAIIEELTIYCRVIFLYFNVTVQEP